MRRFLFVFLNVLVIFISGCKKQAEETPSMEESPVFYFKGNVGNIPVSMVAGENYYYMYSSYSKDTSGMYTFSGELKQVNCVTNCNALSIHINDSRRTVPGSSSNIDSLTKGMYDYYSDSLIASNFISFQSAPMPNQKTVSFTWNFGDGTESKLQNPTHSYIVPGIYTVCHTISYTTGCANTICNEVKAQSLGDCLAFIEDTPTGDSIIFNAIANGNSPSYYWNFGDSLSMNNTSFSKRPTHRFSSPGIYNVRLEVITVDNCTTRVEKRIITPNYAVGCLANFTYSKLLIPVPAHFSEITIVYKDKNDVIYESSQTTQPSDSYFEILSVDEYQLNEKNIKTKKIHARFKCNVSDGKQVISLTESDAVIAVAYP